MAQITRTDAQAVLVTGAKPQEAFWQDLMDSVIFKDEASSIGGSSGTFATDAEAIIGTDVTKQMNPATTVTAINEFAINVLRDGVPIFGNTLKKLYLLIADINQLLENYYDAIQTDSAIDTAINALPLTYYDKPQVDTLITNSNKTFGHIFGYTDVECDGTNFTMTNYGDAIYTGVIGLADITTTGQSYIQLSRPAVIGFNFTHQIEVLQFDATTIGSTSVISTFFTPAPVMNPILGAKFNVNFDYINTGVVVTKIRIYQIYN
jgi:hypothetical protein